MQNVMASHNGPLVWKLKILKAIEPDKFDINRLAIIEL